MPLPKPTSHFTLFAPNINIGGGLVLLHALLNEFPDTHSATAILDERAKHKLEIPKHVAAHWVRPTVLSRFKAELLLRKLSNPEACVICFHGLPPLFKIIGTVFVYLQNRLLFEVPQSVVYPFRVRIRLSIERRLLRLRAGSVHGFFVQTKSMATAITNLLTQTNTPDKPVWVYPFSDAFKQQRESSIPSSNGADFLYVADDMPHKNHENLLKAWELLAKEGLFPRLTVTLPPSSDVAVKIQSLKSRHPVQIDSVGNVSHQMILELYKTSRALLYPSLIESYGLPLIEASDQELPIIAAELDYVRDVCNPVETFDPHSPLSIARAVKRFMGLETPLPKVHSPSDFWLEINKLCTYG